MQQNIFIITTDRASNKQNTIQDYKQDYKQIQDLLK